MQQRSPGPESQEFSHPAYTDEILARVIKMPVGNQAIDFNNAIAFFRALQLSPKMRSYGDGNILLEQPENTADLSILPVGYTRRSFGTGQRHASKGCYVVQFSNGPDPVLIRKSEWVIY